MIGIKRRNSVTGTSATTLPGAEAAAAEAETSEVKQVPAGERPVEVEQEEKEPTANTTAGPQPSEGRQTLTALRQTRQEREERLRQQELEDEREVDPYAGMSRKERKAAEKAARTLGGTFEDHEMLMALKPREKLVFKSDYFHVDDRYACILGFFHDDASRDDFGAFWGISRIPGGLPDGVSTVMLDQARRKGEKWVNERIKTSEKLDKLEAGEQAQTGTISSRRKAAKIADDVEVASGEIQDGASYLHVHMRLMVKAPSLKLLDEAVETISRLYIDRMGTVRVAAYPGEQRSELSNVFAKNEKKRGKGFHFTSVEYAGSHSLVTNGLNDATGEYVGYMVGDVNNSAVVFDVDGFDRHTVIADENVNPVLNRAYFADMWGSKMSQAAMLNNRRVVHIVLDGANLDRLGPRFDKLSARLDMNHGDINMLELFGREDEELSIFPAHLEKLVLMAEQAYESTDQDRSIIRGSLKETLSQFYIDKDMWARNAKNNRDRLRLVGIAHDQVPRLQDLVTYFDTQYKSLSATAARDDEAVHAYNVLRLIFKDMLDNNGDLFNTYTNDAIDGVANARRVIYDFSGLLKRGKGVAMAQLVNVIGFAVEALSLGDLVVIHGTERIDSRIKGYINDQFEQLFHRGGRVAYLYNNVEKMLDDSSFNRFDAADYTILGPMRDPVVAQYQKLLAQDIPPDLERLVTSRGEKLAYLRRDHTNVVFHTDLALGINPNLEDRRRELGVASPDERVQSTAVLSALGDRAEQREQRVADEGAQARIGMKPNRKARRGPRAGEDRRGSAGRMTRNR